MIFKAEWKIHTVGQMLFEILIYQSYLILSKLYWKNFTTSAVFNWSELSKTKNGMLTHTANNSKGRDRVMVFSAIFNNISAISWRSVVLAEVTAVPGENNQPAARHWPALSHNIVSSRPFQTLNFSGGDRHWLHRKLQIQLPYDHDHDGRFD